MEQSQYEQWKHLQEELKRIKKEELTLRKQIVQEYKVDQNATGTFHVEIFGDEVKIAQADTLKLDIPMLKAVWASLSEEEKLCIEHKPTLIKAEYKKLPNDSVLRLECVVRSLSAPTVTVIS